MTAGPPNGGSSLRKVSPPRRNGRSLSNTPFFSNWEKPMPGGSMPEPHPFEVYLNDHLGGATGACEVARNAVEKFATTSHRNFLSAFLAQVEEDRATLEEMIRAVGGTPNPMKQASAWLMEKVSRIKLSPG